MIPHWHQDADKVRDEIGRTVAECCNRRTAAQIVALLAVARAAEAVQDSADGNDWILAQAVRDEILKFRKL